MNKLVERPNFILFIYLFLKTVYFPSTKFPFWCEFVEVLRVCGRAACDRSMVVPTRPVA